MIHTYIHYCNTYTNMIPTCKPTFYAHTDMLITYIYMVITYGSHI